MIPQIEINSFSNADGSELQEAFLRIAKDWNECKSKCQEHTCTSRCTSEYNAAIAEAKELSLTETKSSPESPSSSGSASSETSATSNTQDKSGGEAKTESEAKKPATVSIAGKEINTRTMVILGAGIGVIVVIGGLYIMKKK